MYFLSKRLNVSSFSLGGIEIALIATFLLSIESTAK